MMAFVQPRVELLRAATELFDVVLGWHWREWSHGETNANLDEWRRRLAARCAPDDIPFTLVAHLEDEPVGCLSLCHDDRDARFAHAGPWLSGMVVVGRARNLGVGRALLDATADRARSLGATQLWVWTTEAGPFYERCGYELAHRKEGVRDSAVLRRAL